MLLSLCELLNLSRQNLHLDLVVNLTLMFDIDPTETIDIFTVICAILDRTPEFNIQGGIKGRDALRLGMA